MTDTPDAVPACPLCSRPLHVHKPTGDLHCDHCCSAWPPSALTTREERRRATDQ